jgi:hypothetical protein
MNDSNVKKLVKLVENNNFEYNQPAKEQFHKLAKKVAKDIANGLGLTEGSYDIRSNMGGIAVCGEVTLHGENIYIQLSKGWNTDRFMYRSCKGRKDYTGGPNQWMEWSDMKNFEYALNKFKHLLLDQALGYK